MSNPLSVLILTPDRYTNFDLCCKQKNPQPLQAGVRRINQQRRARELEIPGLKLKKASGYFGTTKCLRNSSSACDSVNLAFLNGSDGYHPKPLTNRLPLSSHDAE